MGANIGTVCKCIGVYSRGIKLLISVWSIYFHSAKTRFRAIFREHALVFCPVKPTFFSSCLVLGPTSDDFTMARHSFQPRISIFPCFSLYFPTLRALLREISPFIIATLPFSHSVKAFPIRVFPFFILYPTFLFPLISFPPHNHPTLFTFLPHFLSHSSPLFHLPPQ